MVWSTNSKFLILKDRHRPPKPSIEPPVAGLRADLRCPLRFSPRPSDDASESRRCILSALGAVTLLADRITVDPAQCGGRPCVRGLRIRVTDVLDLLAAGLTPEQILEELPDLEHEDVAACLRFASRRLDHPIVAA
jgi:uncharacterized protein (DUF433 family)